MNAHIQAIETALAVAGSDEKIHEALVTRSQKLRQTIDKITACVAERETKYSKIRALRLEMDSAMDHLVDHGEANEEHRPITRIAADLKRVNDSLDKDIDKVYDLISDANGLRREVTNITAQINEIPLVTTAA